MSFADVLTQARIETEKLKQRKLKNEITDWEKHRQEADSEADKSRVYTFNADVNKGSVDQCIEALDHWSRRDPAGEIKIILCSPGGSVFQGLALFDFIEELKGRGHAVTTLGIGWVASMGGVLLQAGTHRVLGNNAWLMIHEPSRSSFLETLRAAEISDEAELFKRMWDQLAEILATRSTMSADEIKTRAERRDWWLRADEAWRLGLCDEIEAGP